MPSLHPYYQPSYHTDDSFSPYSHRCAHSGGTFPENEMVFVEFFCDWVAEIHLEEYLAEVKENVLPCEYETIIKQIYKPKN